MSAATGLRDNVLAVTQVSVPAPTPSAADRLAMVAVRHGIAWERRAVMFLIDSAIHHASGRPDAVEALEQLKISVEAYA